MTSRQQVELDKAEAVLKEQAAYFELCSSNAGALRSANLIPEQYSNILNLAETYSQGADATAARVATTSSYSAEEWRALKSRNPQLFNALYFAAYGHDGAALDAIFLVEGLSENTELSGTERTEVIKTAANRLNTSLFGAGSPLYNPRGARRSGIVAAMREAMAGVSVNDKLILIDEVNKAANSHAGTVANQLSNARMITAASIVLGVSLPSTSAVAACVRTPKICLGSLMTTLAEEGLIEVASGGAGVTGVGTGAVKIIGSAGDIRRVARRVADDAAATTRQRTHKTCTIV